MFVFFSLSFHINTRPQSDDPHVGYCLQAVARPTAVCGSFCSFMFHEMHVFSDRRRLLKAATATTEKGGLPDKGPSYTEVFIRGASKPAMKSFSVGGNRYFWS